MEFIVMVGTNSAEQMELPHNLGKIIQSPSPARLHCRVGDVNYHFRVACTQENKWFLCGTTWKAYAESEKLTSGCHLHFNLLPNEPIYLIQYDPTGCNSAYIYDGVNTFIRPRALAVVNNITQYYTRLPIAWFAKLNCKIKNKHFVLAYNNAYEVEILYENGVPAGFTGEAWNQIYKHLNLQSRYPLVFMHFFTDVFKLQVFTQQGIELKLYNPEDLQLIRPQKITSNNSGDEHNQTNPGMNSKSIKQKKCRLVLSTSVTRKFDLRNYNTATVIKDDIEVEMELRPCSNEEQRRHKHKHKRFYLSGDWKAFMTRADIKQRKNLKFHIDSEILENHGIVILNLK